MMVRKLKNLSLKRRNNEKPFEDIVLDQRTNRKRKRKQNQLLNITLEKRSSQLCGMWWSLLLIRFYYAFNINAQVVLSGPKNIKAVTQQIRSQLSNVNVNAST